MSNVTDVADRRSRAYAQLANLVAEWQRTGRGTTSAGLKSGLQRSPEGFSESDLGFDSFLEFLNAAVAAGSIQVHRLENGHRLVQLPGDPVPDRASPLSQTLGTLPSARLKPDVWAAVVDWADMHKRLWDRENNRAFLFPVDEAGEPLWASQPERFADIPSATQAMQIGWMGDFAHRQSAPDRQALEQSLLEGAPRGSFRRELQARNLVGQWRAELQRLTTDFALEWASKNGISKSEILDGRSTRPMKSAGAISPRLSGKSVRPSGSSTPPHANRSDINDLRRMVHKAVDRMSTSELLALPLRAEHFLAD